MRYDIAIIGTGPAGVSAAITAKIRNKNIILLGSENLSEKISKAKSIKNYTGLPNISGEQLAAALQSHLDDLQIEICPKRASMVYAMGDYFTIQLAGEAVESRSVILANGVAPAKVLEREDEFLGRGVSYCATCDAPLCKGRDVAVVAYTSEGEDEALFLKEVCGSVAYFPLYGEPTKRLDGIEIIRDVPLGFGGQMKADKLICKEKEYDFFTTFVIRDSIAPNRLVPGLKIADGHVEVDLQMRTNISGLFACGDVAGKPYQYIKSAGQGNVAALSAVAYLAKQAN